MENILEILSQHTKQNAPWSWEKDTLEDIFNKLEVEHDIRPDFEDYGNHINYNATWLTPEATERYKGSAYIFTSPYVRLITNDKEIIERCERSINNYKVTQEYKQARKQYLEHKAEQERVYRESMEKSFKKNRA
jgi:hypothetical protein